MNLVTLLSSYLNVYLNRMMINAMMINEAFLYNSPLQISCFPIKKLSWVSA